MEKQYRYQHLAEEIEKQISLGVYGPGEKLPSIRKLHQKTGLSISTVLKAFIELDVTESRQSIRSYRRQTGQRLSFTAFFISCVIKSLNEHKNLNAGLRGNNIIIFDDIDVSVAIEMTLNGESVPRLLVIHRAQNKSVQEIHNEIEDAKRLNDEHGDVVQGDEKNVKLVMLLLKLPKFLRRLIWNKYLRDPFFTKRMMGTVGVTAIGMFGKMSGWPEPIPTTGLSCPTPRVSSRLRSSCSALCDPITIRLLGWLAPGWSKSECPRKRKPGNWSTPLPRRGSPL